MVRGLRAKVRKQVQTTRFSHEMRHQGGLLGHPGWSLGRTRGHLRGPETGPVPAVHPLAEQHPRQALPVPAGATLPGTPLPQELTELLPPGRPPWVSAFHTEPGAQPGAPQCFFLEPTAQASPYVQSSQTLVLSPSFREQRVYEPPFLPPISPRPHLPSPPSGPLKLPAPDIRLLVSPHW